MKSIITKIIAIIRLIPATIKFIVCLPFELSYLTEKDSRKSFLRDRGFYKENLSEGARRHILWKVYLELQGNKKLQKQNGFTKDSYRLYFAEFI